jgi:hypothetical protein
MRLAWVLSDLSSMAIRGPRQHPGTALPFPLWRRESGLRAHSPRSETTKKTSFRCMPQIKSMQRQLANTEALAFAASGWACSLHPVGVRIYELPRLQRRPSFNGTSSGLDEHRVGSERLPRASLSSP